MPGFGLIDRDTDESRCIGKYEAAAQAAAFFFVASDALESVSPSIVHTIPGAQKNVQAREIAVVV